MGRGEAAGGAGRRGGTGGVLSGLAVALGSVLFLGGFVLGAVLYQPYAVPTDSMAPTVAAGDRVLAERIGGSEVRRGDVVVFTDPAWGDVPVVKRVVGVGGDRVACCGPGGRLTLGGRPVDEPYLADGGPASTSPFSRTVPAGRLFLLGDHRVDSQDSRVRLQDGDSWAVPVSAVDARVDATVWPPRSAGALERPAPFAVLPGGVSRSGPLVPLVAAVVSGAALILGGAAWGPLAARMRRG